MLLELISRIFLQILAPVLAMVGLGAAVQRWRSLDVQTLARLNIYLFVPVFLFDRVSKSDLLWSEIAGVGVASLAPIALLGALIFLVMRKRRAPPAQTAAVVVGAVFFNAANFGIPVAQLAFGDAGASVQSLVVMFMNTALFFLGYVILAGGQGRGWRSALDYFKLPMIYAIAAGLLVKEGVLPALTEGHWRWLNHAVETTAAGMVPMALVTLGAQLAQRGRVRRRLHWRLVGPTVAIKLLLAPAMTAAVIALLDALGWDLWPWPGAQLILASAGPTAVNTLLLALELDADAETVADCVFWSTLGSAVSVTVILAMIQLIVGAGSPMPGL